MYYMRLLLYTKNGGPLCIFLRTVVLNGCTSNKKQIRWRVIDTTTQQKRGAEPMMFQCWPSAYGAGPTSKQHGLTPRTFWPVLMVLYSVLRYIDTSVVICRSTDSDAGPTLNQQFRRLVFAVIITTREIPIVSNWTNVPLTRQFYISDSV